MGIKKEYRFRCNFEKKSCELEINIGTKPYFYRVILFDEDKNIFKISKSDCYIQTFHPDFAPKYILDMGINGSHSQVGIFYIYAIDYFEEKIYAKCLEEVPYNIALFKLNNIIKQETLKMKDKPFENISIDTNLDKLLKEYALKYFLYNN